MPKRLIFKVKLSKLINYIWYNKHIPNEEEFNYGKNCCFVKR